MNSKKAKRIRQLVKHLQERGNVDGADLSWSEVDKSAPTVVLNTMCGRAIYQQMKKVSSKKIGRPHQK